VVAKKSSPNVTDTQQGLEEAGKVVRVERRSMAGVHNEFQREKRLNEANQISSLKLPGWV
jgi:hypothetical protein